MVEVLKFYNRALKGPRVDEKDFDFRLLPQRLSELVKKYKVSYQPGEVVPQDMAMARRTFDAAVELLTELGVYCRDTRSIINIELDEIMLALQNIRSSFTMGENSDAVLCYARTRGDRRRPIIIGGPNGAVTSEANFVNILSSYAREGVDGIHTGALQTLFGKPIRARTPIENVACKEEIIRAREAIRVAGRPGLSITGTMSGVSSEAQNGVDFQGGLRPNDKHLVSFLNELKVDWEVLNKIAHNQHLGNIMDANQGGPVIGGYSGGLEGSAITAVAEMILGYVLANPCTVSMDAHNIHHGWSHRSAIWVDCMTLLAFQSVGVPVILGFYLAGSAGPCTDMLCDEIAAQAIALTAAGASFFIGPVGCGMARADYFTGMESRILKEISSAAVDMDLRSADEVTRELIAGYNERLERKQSPKGKSFVECYDDPGVGPSPAYLNLWEEKRRELQGAGLIFGP